MNEGVFPSRKTSTLAGMEEERRIKLLDGWHRAVKCALTWAEE